MAKLLFIHKGYEVWQPTSGGKAGKGHNKTTSIQIRRQLFSGGYVIVKQFRYKVADSQGINLRVQAWLDEHPMDTGSAQVDTPVRTDLLPP